MRWLSMPRINFRPKRFTTFVLMLVIWAGLTSAAFAGISYDLRNRDYLLGRAQTIADALPINQINDLSGSKDDLTSLSYNDIKYRLQQIKGNNHDMGHVYLLKKKQNLVATFVDSEPVGSPDYAAPGEYFDSSERLLDAFTQQEAFLDGPREARGNYWFTTFAPVTDPKTREVVALVAVDTSAFVYYAQVLLYSLVPLLLAAIPFVGLMRDIKLQSKEHEILQLKNQFVSIASHELRSPLTGMLWAIRLMQNDEARLSLKQRGLLHDMFLSTESSLTTVNEILDLSIFERGEKHALQKEQVDVVAVITQIISTLKLGAQEKNIEILQNGKWPKHIYVVGDVGALKRSFMNIIANAIKYTHAHDTVNIHYHRSAEGEHIISIEDHGIGIPKNEQEKVLDGYYRATNASTVQAHGTGLGLWLTRKIAEEHGGRLWLTSTEGKGTTIYLALPDFTPPASAKSAASAHPDQDLSQDKS